MHRVATVVTQQAADVIAGSFDVTADEGGVVGIRRGERRYGLAHAAVRLPHQAADIVDALDQSCGVRGVVDH